MSERGTQVGVARARAGLIVGDPATDPASDLVRGVVDEPAVRRALGEVVDPELPMVSIEALGMIGRVTVGATIRVELLPTFVGCPALELIERSVATRLAAFGRPVEVVASFEVPWTSDRISSAGLAALATAGIAPPTEAALARCPYCASDRVVLDNLFGATQCRSLFYCRDCRQPFEAIKPV